jgi:hypothetical protein
VSDLTQLLDTEFFQIGLRFGVLALIVGWALVLILRTRVRILHIGGILIAAGVSATLVALDEGFIREIFGLALIAAGAGLARALKAPEWVIPLAAVPGAAWIAFTTNATNFLWVRIALLVLIPVCGYLITDFENRYRKMGLGMIFYTLAALGVFVAVPDTEWARVLIAVAVPVVFLAWPHVRVSLGVEGAYVATAVLILVSGQGGEPRPASIVGSIACLGLLVLEPIAFAMSPSIVAITTAMRQNWAGAVLASVPQFVVVALCSRVAAAFTSELPAFITVVVVYMATLAIGFWADPARTATGERS